MRGTRTRSLPGCRPLLAGPGDLTPRCSSRSSTWLPPGSPGTRHPPGSPAPPGPTSGSAPRPSAAWPPSSGALALVKALDTVPLLPADTFLTVDVSPHLLDSGPVQEAPATRPDLSLVVVEPTEHTPVDDLSALRRRTRELRDRGALIALDDTGSGYSGLQQMAVLHPQLVTPDRAPVSDVDVDPVRTALAEMVGEFAGRIDARLLAEGVGTPGELAAFTRLGVPLAPGRLLGR